MQLWQMDVVFGYVPSDSELREKHPDRAKEVEELVANPPDELVQAVVGQAECLTQENYEKNWLPPLGVRNWAGKPPTSDEPAEAAIAPPPTDGPPLKTFLVSVTRTVVRETVLEVDASDSDEAYDSAVDVIVEGYGGWDEKVLSTEYAIEEEHL